MKFYTVVCSRLNFEYWVQKFGGPPQEKNLKAKNIQNLEQFRMTSDFGSKCLRNGWRYSKSDKYIFYCNSSCVGGRKLGSLITEMWWNRIHPSRLFRKTIFWPLGVLHPQIFMCARRWSSLTSTPPSGPPYNFFQRGSKIGLTYSKWMPITSEARGVAQQNFVMWRAAL